MKTGREFLNEHIEETNIPAEHWEVEIGEMMEWYAEYYHQAKLKLLGIADVVGRSEQLHSCKYVKRIGESCTLNNNCKYPKCK